MYGSSPSTMTPVCAANGTLLMKNVRILKRWTAHFSQLFNRPAAVDEQALDDMPQRHLIPSLNETLMSEETVKAMVQIQSEKASRPDGIPPEIYKVGVRLPSTASTVYFNLFGRGESCLKTSEMQHHTSVPQHCRKITGWHPFEQNHGIPSKQRVLRNSVRLQTKQRHFGHGLCHQTAAGKMH